MAKRSNTTRPLHAPNGPVTAAIRAVREPVSPFFVPVRDGDHMVSGWHLGRRHDWSDSGRQEMVWLDVQEDESGWSYGVWRCGGGKPEHPDHWDFALRIVGVRSMPADPLDLSATRH